MSKANLLYEPFEYGDCHVHTSYTDGKNSVFEYCQKAKENNLKSILFSEHVRKEISYDYADFLLEINKAKYSFQDLNILSGCEAKVLNLNGDLDVSESVLNSCDFVTGVFHSFKYRNKECYLKALKATLTNSIVNIWGHPTFFAQKNGIRLDNSDLEKIISLCIDNDIFIELNLKYNLPNQDFLEIAVSNDARFVIGSDAHNINDLLNYQTLKEVQNWINKMS